MDFATMHRILGPGSGIRTSEFKKLAAGVAAGVSAGGQRIRRSIFPTGAIFSEGLSRGENGFWFLFAFCFVFFVWGGGKWL